ncbi:Cysteine-rich_membrane protein 2 [Hexamita inflata]|uniref:Cysteine-rich membrane protein 2 n=1 Tax=Hexamita inflata TaxID=28002 RepID=A0AA86NGL2_9EUKA|nr:Cysteine-rich membrane protein 2 [Hexamita inflata]
MLPAIQLPAPQLQVAQPIILQTEHLSVSDMFCRCKPPQYRFCECCCGILNCFAPGLGLELCCLGYCHCRGECSVFCAGILMTLTAPFIYGWIASIVVGFRMFMVGVDDK